MAMNGSRGPGYNDRSRPAPQVQPRTSADEPSSDATQDTPGRPKSSSRQQTHRDQGAQSGSPEIDQRSAGSGPDQDHAQNAIYHDRPADEGKHGDGEEEPNGGNA